MQLRPALLLAGTVAIAASAGLVISLTQRPVMPTQPVPTPFVVPTPFTFPTPPVDPTPVPRQPISGFGFSVAGDPASQTVMLFGGVDDYNNTWLWNGTRWTLARPSAIPAGRFNAAAAYDPEIRQVLLFGGRLEAGQLVNDTWAWDGRTWRELNSGKGGPPPGEFAAMAWDSALSEMVLVSTVEGGTPEGRETWTWSGTRWIRRLGGSVPLDTSFHIGFDPISNSLLATGCCGSATGGNGTLVTTWRWNGTAWHQVPTQSSPPPDYGWALDPARGQLVLVGSTTATSRPQLWSWDGNDWMMLGVVTLQPAYPDALITDVNGGQLLMLGSVASASQGGAQPVSVWALRGTSWHQLAS